MMKLLFLAATFAISLSAFAQDDSPLPATKIPLRADAPQLFAPRGWKIEKTIRGDLNRDKIPDAALVLQQDYVAKDAEGGATARARALVVLLKEGKGWHRVGFNASMLLGTRDGGALYGVVETPVNVSIKRGVLEINQENGSREVTQTTEKFRLDKNTQRFYLIGRESSEYDRANGYLKTFSTNYLTGVQEEIGIEGKRGRRSGRTTRVSRKLRTLESIKVEERYAG